MKKFLIVVVIPLLLWACSKTNVSTNNEFMPDNSTGTAVIEGRIGYFSPALPPPNSNNTFFPYPSGYILNEYHWINTDTPKVVKRLYLDGDFGNLKHQYAKISGSWKEIIKTQDNVNYSYFLISVDSLRIIQ